MPTIAIGIDKNGTVAAEAKDVAAIVKVDSEGNTKTVSFNPKTKNPGQEVMQAAGEVEAIVMGLMQGPQNSKKKIVQIRPGTNIDEVVEKYKQSELYATKKGYEKKITYNTPKQDGSGKGTRANAGRNPECSPEEYKAMGQGSGTLSGRVAESKPLLKATQSSYQSNDDDTMSENTSKNTIDSLVIGRDVYDISRITTNYSDAKTTKQKQKVAEVVKQYLREAHEKNLKGDAAIKYTANKLKEKGYFKINANSNKSKTPAKKAA